MCNDEESRRSSTQNTNDNKEVHSSSGSALGGQDQDKSKEQSRFKDTQEDKRSEEEKKEADRKYDEAIEEEYAKREGGA